MVQHNLIASLKSVSGLPAEGRVWNIALGTGVGFGFTNKKQEVKKSEHLSKLFDCNAWDVKVPSNGKAIWEVGTVLAFKKLEETKKTNEAIKEYAELWKEFIEKKLIAGKDSGRPSVVVYQIKVF